MKLSSLLRFGHSTSLSETPTSSQTGMRADSNGYLQIKNGTNSEQRVYADGDNAKYAQLEIAGATTEANYVLQLPNSSTQKAKAYSWDQYSSLKWKTKVMNVKDPMSPLHKLRPVFYRWKKGYGDNGEHRQIGFIAEEVKKVLPALSDGEGVEYAKLTSLLVAAVQDQDLRIKELEKKIKSKK